MRGQIEIVAGGTVRLLVTLHADVSDADVREHVQHAFHHPEPSAEDWRNNDRTGEHRTLVRSKWCADLQRLGG
jgi:hypothetical protein